MSHIINDVKRQFSFEDKHFGFDMFLAYMQELCQRLDFPTEGMKFDRTASHDSWAMKKRELRHRRVCEKIVRREKEFAKREFSDTKLLIDAMRGIPSLKPIRLSDAHKQIRRAETDIQTMELQVKKEHENLQFLQWRQKDSKERFLHCKQMADGLGQRMKIQEANEMHRNAERFRKDGERVEMLIQRQRETIERFDKKLRRAVATKSRAEALVHTQVGNLDLGVEHDVGEAEILLNSEAAKVRKGREEAELSRSEHMERAAELFLQAAEQGLVEAQQVVAQMYSSAAPLPESWVPKTEEDLSDRDRGGLLQYRAALDAAKQRRRAREKQKFIEFSFQTDIERRVAERVDKDKRAKMEEALKEFSYVSLPEDENHPTYSAFMRATRTNSWQSAQNDETQLQQEFEEWYAKRFRQERAAYWFMQAALSGHAGSQYEVGMMYLRGYRDDDDPQREQPYVPLPLDPQQAVAWLRRATQGEHAEAMCELGICLLRGVGTEVDVAEARKWLAQSAACGVAEGMYQLGLCWERGVGDTKDAARAVAYYRQAAEQGLVNAQVALAICLERGEGVEQNERAAVEWYRRAGEQSSEAQYLLGKCLEDGRGVTRDLKKA